MVGCGRHKGNQNDGSNRSSDDRSIYNDYGNELGRGGISDSDGGCAFGADIYRRPAGGKIGGIA